jgi:2-C-methyl-D-erythritol 2,4-cyclodiphosphate synthase
MKAGFGYDIHRLAPDRPLVLGGVHIPFGLGEVGFSDGDVLIHAVIDALLGPAGLGDIGSNFPPGREDLRGISSRILLQRTSAMLSEAGWTVGNLDCVVVLEQPRILPHVAAMRQNMASDLGLSVDQVTVKGKTAEGLDAIGEGRAVAAYAVSCIRERAERGDRGGAER